LKAHQDLVEVIRKDNGERRALKDAKLGTHRIDVRLNEQLKFTASFGGFSFTIDEPTERGGTGVGPPPLAHFLAGAVSCLMTQFQKLALEKGVVIDSMKTVARGHFDMRLGGAFSDVCYDIEMQSSASPQTIKGIAQQAELMCYAHNTLRKCVTLKTNLTLNGDALIVGN